jgi:hypothetical protein
MERLDSGRKSQSFLIKNRLNPLSTNIDPESAKNIAVALGLITTLITSISILMYRHGWFGKELDQKDNQNNSPNSVEKNTSKK